MQTTVDTNMETPKPFIPRPDTREYYRDALTLICAIAVDWDGYDPNNAEQMRGLIKDMVEVAGAAIDKKPSYVTDKETI